MKGIILTGGCGTRSHPFTLAISKQLLQVYDKHMIYYPLSVLFLAGIRDILVISTPFDLPLFKRLLGTGEQWGVNFSYIEQLNSNCLPHAFILSEGFIAQDSVALILRDNIFYGVNFPVSVKHSAEIPGVTVFAYTVRDPERYGVVELDENKKAVFLKEKPKSSRSKLALTGLYIFDNRGGEISKQLKPSARGELEILDEIRPYLAEGKLYVQELGRGFACINTVIHDSLPEAGTFVATSEKRHGLKIPRVEEIDWNKGSTSLDQLCCLGNSISNSDYYKYLPSFAHSS